MLNGNNDAVCLNVQITDWGVAASHLPEVFHISYDEISEFSMEAIADKIHQKTGYRPEVFNVDFTFTTCTTEEMYPLLKQINKVLENEYKKGATARDLSGLEANRETLEECIFSLEASLEEEQERE